MKHLTFNTAYFIIFLLLLATELVIAVYLKDGFIRHTFGDYLVVILMYCFIKSFIKHHCKAIAIGVLVFAYIIEVLQAFNLLKLINMQHNHLANLILGSTFSIADLVAYTFGFITIIFVEFQLRTTN
jgi:hypothetical protein